MKQETNKPKKDGSGKGTRANKGKGCKTTKPVGQGKSIPREVAIEPVIEEVIEKVVEQVIEEPKLGVNPRRVRLGSDLHPVRLGLNKNR